MPDDGPARRPSRPSVSDTSMPKPRRPLGVHLLEDRSVPATFGVPWADPDPLPLSLAPDGTETPTVPRVLGPLMIPPGPATSRQREVLRAIQTWAAATNINVGLVADGGQALGAVGAVQGDSRFGDIRLAAAPLAASLVAGAA